MERTRKCNFFNYKNVDPLILYSKLSNLIKTFLFLIYYHLILTQRT